MKTTTFSPQTVSNIVISPTSGLLVQDQFKKKNYCKEIMHEMQLVNIVSENTVPPAALQPNVNVPKYLSCFKVIYCHYQ